MNSSVAYMLYFLVLHNVVINFLLMVILKDILEQMPNSYFV